jgi:uncharacterized protein
VELIKALRWPFLFTALGLAGAFWYGIGREGALTALAITAILIVLEVSLSFDNAVVNAKVLNRMSEFWRTIFLTVGIVIAVFGMRLLFPLVIVFVTADLGPLEAWRLALSGDEAPNGLTYAENLEDAEPLIAAFGGMFLLMIFLDFIFDEEKEHHWIGPLERFLSRIAAFPAISVLVALVWLFVFGQIFSEETEELMVAGVFGIVLYLLVGGLGDFLDSGLQDDDEDEAGDSPPVPAGVAPGGGTGASDTSGGTQTKSRAREVGSAALATGRAGFVLFLYLELLDASFSFDGVIGAFAITTDPIIIAIGLGVGAFYVRSITIYLVHQGTLSEYVFLEHGAHWAIGALALLLFLNLGLHVPEVVTGLIGVGFILAAFYTSIVYNRHHRDEDHTIHV